MRRPERIYVVLSRKCQGQLDACDVEMTRHEAEELAASRNAAKDSSGDWRVVPYECVRSQKRQSTA